MKKVLLTIACLCMLVGCDEKKKTPPKTTKKPVVKKDTKKVEPKKQDSPTPTKPKAVDISAVKPVAVTGWKIGKFPMTHEFQTSVVQWKADKDGAVKLSKTPDSKAAAEGNVRSIKGRRIEPSNGMSSIDIMNPPSMPFAADMNKEVEVYDFATKKWTKQKVEIKKGDKKYTYGHVHAEGTEPGIAGFVNRTNGKFVAMKYFEELAPLNPEDPKSVVLWVGGKNDKVGDIWFKYDPSTMKIVKTVNKNAPKGIQPKKRKKN